MRSVDSLNGVGVGVIADRGGLWIGESGPAAEPAAPSVFGAIARWRQRLRAEFGADARRRAAISWRVGGAPVGGVDLAAITAPPAVAPLRIQRRRIAVLAADIAGFSRLIELDDLDTALRVRHLWRCLIEPAARAHRGRVVDLAGDGLLMAFAGPAGAVECAVAIQRGLNALERDSPADRRIRLRIGMSVDDTLVIDGDLYGRAVNVAARLEALAAPGDVYLSGTAFEQLGGSVAVRCEPLGERKLRNIAEPVRVYRVARSELGG